MMVLANLNLNAASDCELVVVRPVVERKPSIEVLFLSPSANRVELSSKLRKEGPVKFAGG